MSPSEFVSLSLSVYLALIHVLWTKGGLGQPCMEVESGEGVRRCFPHFPLFFQVPFPYLLVFIYFSPLVPLYQKAWRHICHRHRPASSQVSPMLLREVTISSDLLPNMHLPPLAKHGKAKFPFRLLKPPRSSYMWWNPPQWNLHSTDAHSSRPGCPAAHLSPTDCSSALHLFILVKMSLL